MTVIEQEILGGVIGLTLGALLLLALDYDWHELRIRWRDRKLEPGKPQSLSAYDEALRNIYAPGLLAEINRTSVLMDMVRTPRPPTTRRRALWLRLKWKVRWLKAHRPHLHFGPCDHSDCY